MPPIITQQAATPAAVAVGIQPQQMQQPMPGTIPLSQLIDFIVQKTYHDLTVLSELLVLYCFVFLVTYYIETASHCDIAFLTLIFFL